MAASAAVGNNDKIEKEASPGLDAEVSSRVDDAIRSYFDRLVERTEVPPHILEIIMGRPGRSNDCEDGPCPA